MDNNLCTYNTWYGDTMLIDLAFNNKKCETLKM